MKVLPASEKFQDFDELVELDVLDIIYDTIMFLGPRKYDSQVLPNAFAAGGTCRWPAQQPHDLGEVAPTVRSELKK